MNIKNITHELLASNMCLAVDVEFDKDNNTFIAEVIVEFDYHADNDVSEIETEIMNLSKLPVLTVEEVATLLNEAINSCKTTFGGFDQENDIIISNDENKYGKSL